MSETEPAELPHPSQIIPDESKFEMHYQGMTELSDEEYTRLADDIRDRGVLEPVYIDEHDRIIDGHHREALSIHFNLDESKRPDYVVIDGLNTDSEKLARSIKQNLLGRDTTDPVKSEAVKYYIKTAWDRTDDGDFIRPETDTEVAEKLGVSRQVVSQVIKNAIRGIIYHDRVQAREYYAENPDASYREVARQVDSSQPTVTEWLKEDFDERDSNSENDNDGEHETKQTDDPQHEEQQTTQTDDSRDEEQTEQQDTGQLSNNPVDPFTSQQTDEWSSPREIVEPLADALDGFDLDPCSGAEDSPFADATYTEADDGLAQPWHGTVWVNPPYSEMPDWTAKVTEEADSPDTDMILYLCKGDSSTAWWHDALDAASLVVAIDHRLSFGDGESSAPFASHIFVFGTPSNDVLHELADHGAVLSPLSVRHGGDPDG